MTNSPDDVNQTWAFVSRKRQNTANLMVPSLGGDEYIFYLQMLNIEACAQGSLNCHNIMVEFALSLSLLQRNETMRKLAFLCFIVSLASGSLLLSKESFAADIREEVRAGMLNVYVNSAEVAYNTCYSTVELDEVGALLVKETPHLIAHLPRSTLLVDTTLLHNSFPPPRCQRGYCAKFICDYHYNQAEDVFSVGGHWTGCNRCIAFGSSVGGS